MTVIRVDLSLNMTALFIANIFVQLIICLRS